jgi:hypothetical protein
MTTLSGCQTDHAAQDYINQMRAEQIAIEDRYASLRNEYEKLRNRMAAQGDAESRNPGHPSALPLTYPPGESALDLELNGPADLGAWSLEGLESQVPTADPQRMPIPAISNGASVLEQDRSTTGPLTATPTRLQLVEQQTSIKPGSAPGSFVVRVVVRPTNDRDESANPIGTYSMRLFDPRAAGADSPSGYWSFPAEKIRTFVKGNPANAGNGVPLEVVFAHAGASPPELVAEIEFHPVAGTKLTCRGFVGANPNSDPQLRPWIDELPVPKGADGLMGNNPPISGVSTVDAPSWRPVR